MKIQMKIGVLGLSLGMLVAGCGPQGFDPAKEIGTVSREDGSGTRTAFTELFGILRKENGKKVDHTSVETVVASSTAVMLTTIAGDRNALGYLSLGSLDSSVRALPIDGVAPTADNIRAGKYKITHPFNLLVKGTLSEPAQDFLSYILSADGQAVVEKNGYVSVVTTAQPYRKRAVKGKVTVSGSSSVTPLMEKFKESYQQINPEVKVEVQQSDSSTGVSDARDSVSDIGMASRGLKDAEKDYGLTVTACALDGIAMIVNKDNTIDGLSSEAVRKIYEGEMKTWAEAQK